MSHFYKTKNHLIALFLFSLSFTAFSQGKITGKILDGEINDVLPFADVTIKGTSIGTTSDFDGLYELNVKPGTYTVIFSFIGYETKAITDVVVKNNGVVDLNTTLSSSSESLEEIVITTTRRKNTEAAVLTMQKSAVKLMDGLSIETIKNTGASDTASAVKNVPGVSVQGGKYVYVRGLGDRYTKTLLNGMEVPGLDPDRNTLQLDIFPTSILENIIVVKSFTADQSADFTGGIVDIITKDFPSKKEYSISVGIGVNSSMHFRNDHLKYEGSSTDFLGFDNGKRDNPLDNVSGTLPLPQLEGELVRGYTEEFDKTLAPERSNNLADFSIGFSMANQIDLGDNKLGYLASVSYKNETTFYEDYTDGQLYRKNDDSSINELVLNRGINGEVGTNNVLLTGLAGISYKRDQSKYKFNILHIQNGESESSIFNQDNIIGNSNQVRQDNLLYTQRSITNALLSGKHTNEDASWNIDWKLSPTLTRVEDKDFRSTNFLINEDDDGNISYTIDPSEAGDPRRFWRELEEVNFAGKLDFTKKHKFLGENAKLKFGGSMTYKQRDFTIDQFSTPFAGLFDTSVFNGDGNQVLLSENVYNTSTSNGVYVTRDSNISDTFDSKMFINAGYISEEMKLTDKFHAIVGVRFEKFDLIYTGENQQGDIFNEEKILDKADIFPSVNLIYDLDEDANQKLRGSVSRTTARPSFKEASLAEIFDPTSNTFFIGNIDIQPTYINNFDLRYENYGEGSNFLALSAFYKDFTDPIELSFIREATGQYTPLNLSDAIVYGLELEFRRNLGFINGFENFNISTNISIIESNQDFSDDERDAREANLRDGEELPDGRTLQGQSPYLINVGITYKNEEKGWKSGLFYNVQGKTLEFVGNGNIPDIYTLPFHSLDMNFSKSFGKEKNSSLSLKFKNLLISRKVSVYESFGAEDQIFSEWFNGQQISLGYSYKF